MSRCPVGPGRHAVSCRSPFRTRRQQHASRRLFLEPLESRVLLTLTLQQLGGLPSEGETSSQPVNYVSLRFNSDLDRTTVDDPSTWDFREAGFDGAFHTPDDQVYSFFVSQFNVSSSSLVHLDFQKRELRLEEDETTMMQVIGDFADEPNVVLPASYVAFSTTDDSIPQILPTGQLVALREGAAAVVASKGTIQTATAVNVGTTIQEPDFTLLGSGIAVSPEALVLEQNGGTRQIKVGTPDDVDLSEGIPGTRYFITNRAVATVSDQGLVVGGEAGATTIIVISGPAEKVLAVQVVAARSIPAVLGSEGGVARSAAGAEIYVPPGALTADTTVNVALLDQADLPLALPSDFEFVAGIDLELGTDDLAWPAALAVPVGNQLAAGTTVYFLRAGSVPDENGVLQPIWFQEEVGTVGSDQMARTTSPPWKGVVSQGKYAVARGTGATLTGRVVYSSRGADTSTHQIAVVKGSTAVMTAEGKTFAMALPPGAHELKLIDIPPQRKPKITGVQVTVDPNSATTRTFLIDPAPVPAALQITDSHLTGDGAERTLILTVPNFSFGDPPLQVAFEFAGSEADRIAAAGAANEQTTVKLLIYAGEGDDRVIGGAGDDGLYAGRDRNQPLTSLNSLIGGAGDDRLYGSDSKDILWGDTYNFDTPTWEQFSTDLANGIFRVQFSWSPIGNGRDTLLGGDGFDVLIGGDGSDILDGEQGIGGLFFGGSPYGDGEDVPGSSGSLPDDVVNGQFTVTDPGDPQFGWSVRGRTTVTDGQATLTEGGMYFAGLQQAFVVPARARALQFRILEVSFEQDPNSPPDAFEVALLNAATSQPLVALTNLAGSDVLLNLQAGGEKYLADQVTVTNDPEGSGQLVELDLSGIPAGTAWNGTESPNSRI